MRLLWHFAIFNIFPGSLFVSPFSSSPLKQKHSLRVYLRLFFHIKASFLGCFLSSWGFSSCLNVGDPQTCISSPNLCLYLQATLQPPPIHPSLTFWRVCLVHTSNTQTFPSSTLPGPSAKWPDSFIQLPHFCWWHNCASGHWGPAPQS